MIALIEKKVASMPADKAEPAVAVARSVLQSYVGSYRNDASGFR